MNTEANLLGHEIVGDQTTVRDMFLKIFHKSDIPLKNQVGQDSLATRNIDNLRTTVQQLGLQAKRIYSETISEKATSDLKIINSTTRIAKADQALNLLKEAGLESTASTLRTLKEHGYPGLEYSSVTFTHNGVEITFDYPSGLTSENPAELAKSSPLSIRLKDQHTAITFRYGKGKVSEGTICINHPSPELGSINFGVDFNSTSPQSFSLYAGAEGSKLDTNNEPIESFHMTAYRSRIHPNSDKVGDPKISFTNERGVINPIESAELRFRPDRYDLSHIASEITQAFNAISLPVN